MTSLIGVIHADTIFLITIHASLTHLFIEHMLPQHLITAANILLQWKPDGLYGPFSDCRCMSCLVSLLSILLWWIDTNKRQAYVQASFGWPRRNPSWL